MCGGMLIYRYTNAEITDMDRIELRASSGNLAKGRVTVVKRTSGQLIFNNRRLKCLIDITQPLKEIFLSLMRKILPRDAEEKAWADGATARKMVEIRTERNEKLASTDWWGASDNTMTDAQKKYRADLRDYPATYTADNSADWPTKP